MYAVARGRAGLYPPTMAISRGRLRIYLGAAAGVGKTYAALGDARLADEDGVVLVIGYLEPHGRTATEERARGLEQAPLRDGEPDLDWLRERRASVVLLDELAHSKNGGGKRHEDVGYLLDRGIDVWTTVNVQHVESLRDRVCELTGVEVAETFPDHVLHRDDEIRLVDLAPGALRERIARGLVYREDRIERALTSFFSIQNLLALRSLVLHELAEMAEADLEHVRPGATAGTAERVLVATGGRSRSITRQIRTGARLARRSDGELYVLVVEPEDGRLAGETARVLADAEALTESLGGVFLRRRAPNPAHEIIREAGALAISQIVIGRSRRSLARARLGGTIVEAVMRGTNAGIHVVPRDGG